MARAYHYDTGGRVIIPIGRRAEANSKNERSKLAKELGTARKMAHEGMRVEFNARGAGTHDIFVDGVPAEQKKAGSADQIIKRGKKAIRKQGAKIVIFDFTEFVCKHISKLKTLAKDYYTHGRYYTPGHSKSRPNCKMAG